MHIYHAFMIKRRGFTLVEVMVAAAIFAVGLLGLFGIGRMMHRTSLTSVADGIALHAVEGLMEQLRVQPYEDVLINAARATPGSVSIPVRRYQGANARLGTAGQMVEQLIMVNPPASNAIRTSTYTDGSGKQISYTSFTKDGFTTLEGVNLSTTLNSKFAVVEEQPMKLRVKILMSEVRDVNFATGVTIEVIYEYHGSRPDQPDSTSMLSGMQRRAIRTFIPAKIT